MKKREKLIFLRNIRKTKTWTPNMMLTHFLISLILTKSENTEDLKQVKDLKIKLLKLPFAREIVNKKSYFYHNLCDDFFVIPNKWPLKRKLLIVFL